MDSKRTAEPYAHPSSCSRWTSNIRATPTRAETDDLDADTYLKYPWRAESSRMYFCYIPRERNKTRSCNIC